MHRVCVFDLDGVLYRMDDPVPGAREALERLRARGTAVFFLTNNSSRTRQDYVRKLQSLGMRASVEEVMTSAYAAGRLFQEWGAVGRTVYVVGESGLRQELAWAGMRVVDYSDEAAIDYVVVGWDRSFTYQKLTEAHLAIGRGARFVATNRDATYPNAGGRTLPGSGALVAAVEACTGVTPFTVGKPETYALDLILRQAGCAPPDCLVVGDRLDTDIAVGLRAGTATALVLTGVSTRADVEARPDLRPDYIWDSLDEMP